MAAFLSQIGALFVAIVKLKRWRFLWLIVFGASVMSNHLLYKVVSSWLSNFGLQSYFSVDGDTFAKNSAVMGQLSLHQNKFNILLALINEQRTQLNEKYAIQNCSQALDKNDCPMKFLNLIIRQSDNSYSHYVEYSNELGGKPKIICNMAFGSEAYCPFLASLVATAGYGVDKAQYRYKNISTFRYVPRIAKPLRPKLDKISGANTLCVQDPEFLAVMPRSVMVQAFLLLCSIFIYLLASTVPCIGDLKRQGFLQMLFRRGLSVPAFWLAQWAVTLLELLLVSAGLAASHYLQCPSFYSLTRLAKVALVFATQAGSITSLVFLMTVAIETQFVIGIATLLLASASSMVLAASLILLHWLHGLAWTRVFLLALPPGLLGEQLQAVLASQLWPDAEANFHTWVLVVSICLLVVAALLTLYLDCVLTSGSGMYAGTPHFPCLVACGRSARRVPSNAVSPESPQATVEPGLGAKPAAQLRGVSKIVGSCVGCCGGGVKALSNVNATLYENQLSAFVGHSGSGKSTLLSILSGKTTASAGQIVLAGYDLSDARSRRKIMLSTGVCYQHNALCLDITVADSIDLVRRACGIKRRKHEAEANPLLERLGLREKLGERVCYLSSGQRRKLCIALALLGNPKVIILDEPTSNLDPASRVQLWKLLQEYRVGRCIILGTTLMEEADALADRNVFLSGGAVVCAGSPLFFRRAFDCGFVFQTLVKTERHASWVLRDINRQFPTVRARSICLNELELEVTATHDQLLPGVAIALEKMPELIDAIGLSQRSLDQIFRQLTAMSPEEVNRLFQTGEIGYSADEAVGDFAISRRPKQSIQRSPTRICTERKARNSPTLLRRMALMMKISIARIVRKKSNIFSRIIFPVALLLLFIAALVFDKILKNSRLSIWSVLMDSSKKNFTEGICIDDTDIAGYHHRPEPRLCREMYNPLDNSSTSFIFKSKVTSTPLYNHLSNSMVRDYNFQKKCSEGKIQCPLFYANDWCEDHVTNDKRTISMGMYSLNEVFEIEKATTTLLWIYRKAVKRFNFHLYSNVTMDATVTGVKDFRSTFVPVFGVFLQIFILSMIPATYLDDLIEDRASGVRHHLTSLGMSCFPYWISMFMVHWVQYALVYILSTILLIAIQPKLFFNMCFFLGITIPTVFLGLTSNQLSAYFVSTIFSKQNAALTIVYAIFSTVIGLSLILAQVDNMSGLVIICIFPQVASIAMTFYGTKLIIYAVAFTKVKKLTSLPSPLSILMMSLHMKLAFVAMVCHILLLCLAILLMEKRRSIARCCCACCHRKASIAAQPLDSDDDLEVRQETSRLDSGPRDSRHALEVRHLRLLDRNGAAIVRDVTFGVRPGEIFGLVGPNGSGKTALVSAIAGDLRPNAGDTEVLVEEDLWLPSHEAASRGSIGYCQTSNPLLSHVTVEEHLKFYAAVLGLASDDSSSAVEELLKTFHLTDVKGKMTRHISSSCKRRLGMAITVLGDPTVVIIDDPSEGSDLDERRIIWKALISVASNNRAVVVAMHSMEEVEGLCTRVGVVNQGLLVAIGDVNRIIDRYGLCYTLSVKLEEDASQTSQEHKRVRVEALLKAIGAKYKDAVPVEHMAASALVCVPAASIGRLSNALKWLLDHKRALGIALFSLRRVHLDEIFQLIVRGHDERLQRSGRATDSMVEAIPVDHMGDAAVAGQLQTSADA